MAKRTCRKLVILFFLGGLFLITGPSFAGEVDPDAPKQTIAPQVNSLAQMMSEISKGLSRAGAVTAAPTRRSPDTFGEITRDLKADEDLAEPGDAPQEALPDATRSTSTPAADPELRKSH